MPKPTVGVNTITIMEATSYFAEDIAVTYTIKFAPSYYVPTGSKITINFPPSFSHIPNSSPSAVCTILNTTYLENCVIG